MNAWIVRAGRGGIHAAEWLEGGYVAIYWDLDGADVSALDKEGIKRLYKRKNPDASPQTVASNAGMIYRFAHDIAEGRTVVM